MFMNALTSEIITAWRLLTFRATTKELRALNYRHLGLGIICTWLVGVGRWWEDPRAGPTQHLGLGSVLYIFVFAGFLWFILWPLNPPHWSWLNVVTFISLTSPPGILYALPVRHGLSIDLAQTVRFWMLAVVAGWRVGLLAFYLRRGAGLTGSRALVGTLFPLAIIVCALTTLNLDKVVFDFMGEITGSDRSVNDAAYGVLVLITFLSVLVFVPLLISYAVGSFAGISERLRAQAAAPKNGLSF